MTRWFGPLLIASAAVGCHGSVDNLEPARPVARGAEMAELDSEVLEEIDVLVRSAFWDRERILAIMCEELYAPGDLDEETVARAIADRMQAWRAAQAEWPAVTDCDRLDQAFAKLQARGVVALHNAGMTQSDGYDDFCEIRAKHPRPDELVGYCFYHGQDLERVVRGGPLFLAFGPCDPELEESEGVKVGRMVVQELIDAGLKVEWSGAFASRMSIPDFQWQRRAAPNAR